MFRKKRAEVVDKYILIRRTQYLQRQVLALAITQEAFKKLKEQFIEKKEKRAYNIKLLTVCFKMKLSCKRWKNRHGGAAKRHLNYHRNVFASSALMITPMS